MNINIGTNSEYTIYHSSDICTFAYKTKTMNSGYCDQIHTYDALKIVRITDGSGIWNINGKDFCVTENDIIIFSGIDTRHIKEVRSNKALKIEQVEFMPITIYPWHICADFFLHAAKNNLNLLKKDNIYHEKILKGFDEIKSETKRNEKNKNACIIHILTGMVINASRLVECTSSDRRIPQKSQYDIVCNAMKYINENLSENLSRNMLANKYFINPSHFSRIFKEYSGVCLQEYITSCRISAVISLLKSSDKSILDIAYECGFSSSSGFYKAFKNTVGIHPKAFRSMNNALR